MKIGSNTVGKLPLGDIQLGQRDRPKVALQLSEGLQVPRPLLLLVINAPFAPSDEELNDVDDQRSQGDAFKNCRGYSSFDLK